MRPVRSTNTALAPQRRARRRFGRLGFLAWLLAWSLPLVGEADETWRSVRVRVTIEAAEPIAWFGELTLSEGVIERLQPLSIDATAAAGVSLDRGRVRLHHRGRIGRDVFDVTLRGPAGATLTLRMDSPARGPTGEALIRVDEVLTAASIARIGPGGPAIRVSRLGVDRMRVETARKTLVFAPSEDFAFDAMVDPTGVARGESFDFSAALGRGRDGPIIWRSEATRTEVTTEPLRIPVSVPLPSEEGVYRIVLAANQPSGFLARFPTGGSPPPLVERTFQVAVFNPDLKPRSPGAWTETYTYDPASQRWADRTPEWMRWRRLPWFADQPLSSDGNGPVRRGPESARIAPSQPGGLAHWRAYPLPIAEPGATYAVEVETSGEPGDPLTIALLEPDALGDLRPLGTAVTTVQPFWNRQAKAPPVRMLVRPRTASPLLLIANPSERKAVAFGRIRLLKSGGAAATPPAEERLVAVDWTRADLPHAVGASHLRSRVGRFEEPDLVTAWETATAIADRVELAGANAAVVSVNEAGGSIYPSDVWRCPNFDLGVWDEGAADLPRRPQFDLLLRHFERRGLKLLPAFRFESPVAQLEAAGDRPFPYNASDPAVIDTRRQAVRELLDLSNDHPALAGVAIRSTVADWTAPTEGRSSQDSAESVARSYTELQRLVRDRIGGSTPLVLLPAELIGSGSLQAMASPRLGSTAGTQDSLRDDSEFATLLNLGSGALMATPVATTRYRFDAPTAWDQLGFEALQRLADRPARDVQSLHAGRHQLQLINSSARLSRGQPNGAANLRLPAVVADGQRTAAAVAAADSARLLIIDGHAAAGRIDDREAARRRAYASAPANPAARNPETTPDTVDVRSRAIDRPDGCVVVTTNQCGWARKARVTIETERRVRGRESTTPSGPTAPVDQWFQPGLHAIAVELAPYETVAWRFDQPGVSVDGVSLDPAPIAQRELAETLADLQSRDTTQRRGFTQLENPSFESDNDVGQPSGWQLGPGAELDRRDAHQGDRSVRLRASNGQPAELTSVPFPLPRTGQFVLGLQVHVDRIGPATQLRIDFEQVNGPYRRNAVLNAAQLSGDSTGGAGWQPIVFPADDLPLTADGEMRVRFTLQGDAEIGIDALEAEDLVLPLDGDHSIDLRSERFAVVRLLRAAETALEDGRLEACRELLDSYWARFLMENFPRRDDEIASTDPESIEADGVERSEPETAPSMSERLRGYLPRWWR